MYQESAIITSLQNVSYDITNLSSNVSFSTTKNKQKYGENQCFMNVTKYLISGVVTTIVNFMVFLVLTRILNPDVALQLQIANIIAWFISVFVAYLLNKNYVFQCKENKLIMFYLSRIFTLIIESVLIFLIVSALRLNSDIGKIITSVVGIMLNYIISKYITFRR